MKHPQTVTLNGRSIQVISGGPSGSCPVRAPGAVIGQLFAKGPRGGSIVLYLRETEGRTHWQAFKGWNCRDAGTVQVGGAEDWTAEILANYLINVSKNAATLKEEGVQNWLTVT